jgi:hypothetical protein
MYSDTPSMAKSVGRSLRSPVALSRSARLSVSKFTGTKVTESGTSMFASASRRRFQAWVSGWSTSNTRSTDAR